MVISFRCGFFNIGAQGQFYMGAIAATLLVDGLNGMSPVWSSRSPSRSRDIVGCAGSGRWPGLLRVKSGTDEVITTLMGNFIAGLFLVYVTAGPASRIHPGPGRGRLQPAGRAMIPDRRG